MAEAKPGSRWSMRRFSPIEGFAHPVARIFFTTQGRFFDLMVEFGTASPEQLARANDLLATLRIEARS